MKRFLILAVLLAVLVSVTYWMGLFPERWRAHIVTAIESLAGTTEESPEAKSDRAESMDPPGNAANLPKAGVPAENPVETAEANEPQEKPPVPSVPGYLVWLLENKAQWPKEAQLLQATKLSSPDGSQFITLPVGGTVKIEEISQEAVRISSGHLQGRVGPEDLNLEEATNKIRAYQERFAMVAPKVPPAIPAPQIVPGGDPKLDEREEQGRITFRNFSGYCQGGEATLLDEAIGWDRLEIPWADLEPAEGHWNQAALEVFGKLVLKQKETGKILLPLLAYNANWSWDREARQFECGDIRKRVTPKPEGHFETRISRNQRGRWVAEDPEMEHGKTTWPLAEKHVPDWENYVRRVVTFLRKPPYNIEYFQVWNEAHPESGFWDGDMESYMKRIHLPAAKIIQELGGKVVYGGWPSCSNAGAYVNFLDKYRAWDSVDVHDIHYHPLSQWKVIFDAARKRGQKNPSLWMTELGYVNAPGFAANEYPRLLQWALQVGWVHPDQFKVFYFPAGAGAPPMAYAAERGLYEFSSEGGELRPQGHGLLTLARLLKNGPLEPYSEVSSSPRIDHRVRESETKDLTAMEAFRVGDRVVVAVHISAADFDRSGSDSLELKFPRLQPQAIKSAKRVDLSGKSLNLHVVPHSFQGSTLEVPWSDAADSPAFEWLKDAPVRTFFVQIDLQ